MKGILHALAGALVLASLYAGYIMWVRSYNGEVAFERLQQLGAFASPAPPPSDPSLKKPTK